MKTVLTVLFSFLLLQGYSQGSITLQDKPFVYKADIDTSILNSLKSEPDFKVLSTAEQQMFYWVNVFRKNPNKFYSDIINEFLRQFPEANRPEVKTLETDINKLKGSLPLFVPDKGLYKMSSAHNNDLSKQGGKISHISSSGKDFAQRIKEEGSYRCGAENIFIGNNNPLVALILLLIDYGVANKGHRVNLFDKSYGIMGLSFSQMPNGKAIIVQVFACK